MPGVGMLGRRAHLAVAAAAAALGLVAGTPLKASTLARGDSPPSVTLIGDSVPEAFNWPPALEIVSHRVSDAARRRVTKRVVLSVGS